ncbi:MAG: MBL fold metallo-hydrolase, partial [Gammaproteobacteria bacterium]
GFFLSRQWPALAGDGEGNQMIALRKTFSELGVDIVVHEKATEIMPSVWVSGPIPRPHLEKNYPQSVKVHLDGQWMVDHVPDSQALTVLTKDGHIVLLGCGHSGVVNALTHIRNTIINKPIVALMGGLHLYAASDETLGWTADQLREIGIQHLMAGHCTGIEPLIRLRAGLNLSRKTAVVGAVGSKFTYGLGITPTVIAM